MLEQHYPHMVNWMAYQKGLLKENILYEGIGDHCPPAGYKDCPKELSSTILYHGQLILMARISKMMGDKGLADAYTQEALIIQQTLNEQFFDSETNTYGSQTGTAMALEFGVVPKGLEPEVAGGLARIEVTEKKQGHFSTGILGTRRLYNQLTEYGYLEEVFTLLRNKDFPSYQYLFDHGFTTFPEAFYNYEESEADYSSCSHNHPMQAGFAMWLHEYLCGIRPLEDFPAFRKFIIKPYGFDFVDQAGSTYRSVQGKISSKWKVQDGVFTLSIVVPVNTSAMVYIPAEKMTDLSMDPSHEAHVNILGMEEGYLKLEVASGAYRFESQF